MPVWRFTEAHRRPTASVDNPAPRAHLASRCCRDILTRVGRRCNLSSRRGTSAPRAVGCQRLARMLLSSLSFERSRYTTMLERQMQHLPERVTTLESQLMQFREAMRNEFAGIRTEIKRADDDTRVFMRVLYEDVLSRLEMIGESDGPGTSEQCAPATSDTVPRGD